MIDRCTSSAPPPRMELTRRCAIAGSFDALYNKALKKIVEKSGFFRLCFRLPWVSVFPSATPRRTKTKQFSPQLA